MSKQAHPSSSKPSMAILVSSHDAYHDLWPLFFHFFFKYWPEPEYPIYLISNFYQYQDERVKPLLIGKDRGWSDNTLWAAEQIDADYILYVQDDYFLSAPVHAEHLAKGLAFLAESKGRYLNLNNKQTAGRPTSHPCIAELETSIEWMVDLQAAIWDKQYLLDVVEPGWNPWLFEERLNNLAKQDCRHYYTISAEAVRVFPYVEAVMGRFWREQGLDFLKEEDIKPNLRRRPYPQAGQQFYRRYIRSFYKRWMELRDRGEHWLRAGKTHWVEPLPEKR